MEDENTEAHPSFGVIGISRVSGQAALFGSDVTHQHFISIRIKEAERVTYSDTHTFITGRRQLIEVWLTESQFAQMITQPNIGDGVACTIRACQGDQDYGVAYGRPMPPEPEPFTKKYHHSIEERAKRATEGIERAQGFISELLTGVTKPTKANLKALADALLQAETNLQSNLPYVVEQMHEAVEERMATAVTDFETYVSQSLQARGLSDLVASAPKLKAPDTITPTLTSGQED